MITRAAALMLASTLPGFAQNTPVTVAPGLDRFEFGILCHYDDANPNIPMTFAQVSAVYDNDGLFDEVRAYETLKIPGVPELVIGVVSSLPPGNSFGVTSIITHTTTDGRSTEDRLDLSFDDTDEIDAWSFDNIYSNTFGTFRFQTLRGAETIYDVTLQVVPPEEYTGVYPECLQQPS